MILRKRNEGSKGQRAEFLGNRVMKRFILCLLVGLIAHPSITEAQQKVYPHLQVFLVSSGAQADTRFIAFWEDGHKLAAGPFPAQLLELAGLKVALDLSYSKPNVALPRTARLKITRPEAPASQNQGASVVLDQMADLIVDRGVSKMFPDGPFLVIGHNALSEGVLMVGNIMGEIQKKLLACERESRQELGAVLNSLKGTPSYEQVLKTVESTFPPCPLQRS
jgi:hypothetical protein